MNKHEEKNCPKCNLVFECKAGSIMQCQCSKIQISAEERAYIETKYDECLCINCLIRLQKEFVHFKEKFIFKK